MSYELEVEGIETILDHYLALSEHVKALLFVHPVSSGENGTLSASSTPSTQILTIVLSDDNDGLPEEEGSIFIFKPVLTKQEDPELSFRLLAALPLSNALTISVAQSRVSSGTMDLRPGNFAKDSRQVFILTLEYMRQTWKFSADSSEALGSFVSECRRLIKNADATKSLDFLWLDKYRSRHELEVPALFPRPDLRVARKPHADLSPATAGQPGNEESDISLIRDEWLRKRLDEDKSVFSEERDICIRLGTFNVNGKNPSQDLSPWIRPQNHKAHDLMTLPPLMTVSPISLSSFTASDYITARPHSSFSINDRNTSEPDGDPDLYVLGFQELDLSTEALLYSYTTTREDMWVEAILAALGETRDQYTKLTSKQLVGMLVICIVRKDLLNDIKDIRTCAVGTGIMGMMGNKGAVALRFTLDSTVITFVNAHLAAFDDYTERRNSDYHDLSRRLVFNSQAESTAPSDTPDLNMESIFQSDLLFWMGDLNYRIDLPDADVRQLISGRAVTRNYDIRDLLSHDQLTKARLEGKAFEGFQEGEIRHFPSYRFSAGIATDPNGYDIKRRPAWTDRILYQTAPNLRLTQTSYAVHAELTMSDHRPVSAQFRVSTRKATESAYNKKGQSLADSIGNIILSEAVPRLKVLMPEVDFGPVHYKRKITSQLQVQNAGNTPCTFRFVSSEESESPFPTWLSATPPMGVLLPGEVASIELRVYVDRNSAPRLNISEEQLQCTLILHTGRGRDHFIVITGQYQRTCLANDLAVLVRLRGPIRELDSATSEIAKEVKVNAPREIMRLINWLMASATDVPDLFTTFGDPQLKESILESLDTGEEFDFDLTSQSEADKHVLALSFADVLFEFFNSLPSPMIPPDLQQRCVKVTDRDEAFELISAELPGFVVNVRPTIFLIPNEELAYLQLKIWISLTAFLHFIAQQRASSEPKGLKEGSRADILACIFAPILLRDEPGSTSLVSPLAKRRFLLHFIQ